eukprot:1092946-Rhodomonas_salina.3
MCYESSTTCVLSSTALVADSVGAYRRSRRRCRSCRGSWSWPGTTNVSTYFRTTLSLSTYTAPRQSLAKSRTRREITG